MLPTEIPQTEKIPQLPSSGPAKSRGKIWKIAGIIVAVLVVLLALLAWLGGGTSTDIPKFTDIPPRETTRYFLDKLPSILPAEAKQDGYFHNADKIYYSNGPKGLIPDGHGGETYSEEQNAIELPVKYPASFQVYIIKGLYNGAPYTTSLYAKDSADVYCRGEILAGADSATFISFGSYGKDKNNAYFECAPFVRADVATFGPHNGLVSDKSALYCSKRIEVPDPTKIVQVVHNDLMWLAKDQYSVYDLNTCEPLSTDFLQKDLFVQIDPATFEVFGNFAKDSKNVIFFGDPSTPETFLPMQVTGVDAATFQQRERQISGKTVIVAEDKRGIYSFSYNKASSTEVYQRWEMFMVRK